MARAGVSAGDLAREPATVASGLLSWARGEPAAAVRETLDASARDQHHRAYTLWVWLGATEDGAPAWALPSRTESAIEFRPRGPATALGRSLAAAIDAGARADALSLHDWDGLLVLAGRDLDPERALSVLTHRHPDDARVRVARLPESVRPSGPLVSLGPLGVERRADGLRGLAAATGVHPVRVALALAEHGQSVESPPAALVGLLREWGCNGTPATAPRTEPSLAIEDDPCPRRRHARRVLRRMLRMKKVGVGHHTEFDHIYRGAAPDERADALTIGEALVRAGLLGEKPSVGQRHVYLRREALPEIHALIERGETSSSGLAAEWTAPPPGRPRG